MAFKTDHGGMALRAEIKVAKGASSWRTRLSQLARSNGEIMLCTYSLPRDPSYLSGLLDKRAEGVTILANAKFRQQAYTLKARYPALRMLLATNTHAKMALVAPRTVWLSSENLVKSTNLENTVGIHSEAVYTFYRDELVRFLHTNDIEALEAPL